MKYILFDVTSMMLKKEPMLCCNRCIGIISIGVRTIEVKEAIYSSMLDTEEVDPSHLNKAV